MQLDELVIPAETANETEPRRESRIDFLKDNRVSSCHGDRDGTHPPNH